MQGGLQRAEGGLAGAGPREGGVGDRACHPRKIKASTKGAQLPCRPPTVPSASSVALTDSLPAGASAGDLRGPWTRE